MNDEQRKKSLDETLNCMLGIDVILMIALHVKCSQLDAFYPKAKVFCYFEFKLRLLKNLKLFSIRIKELFEPIVLREKGDGFLLFL